MKKEYPQLYLDWVEYLIDRKLYGAWIKDISTYAEFMRAYSYYIWYSSPQKNDRKSVFTSNLYYIKMLISDFNIAYVVQEKINNIVENLCTASVYGFEITGCNWRLIYKSFYEKMYLSPKLSTKLSRKMYRKNHKISSGYKCKVVQPWHNKNYEKFLRRAIRI